MRQRAAEQKQRVPVAPARLTRQEPARPTGPGELPEPQQQAELALRRELTARFDGAFAPPAFSADNAAGIAFLCALTDGAL